MQIHKGHAQVTWKKKILELNLRAVEGFSKKTSQL